MSLAWAVLAANGPDSFVWWEWIGRNLDEIRERTVEHLQLTAVALGVGLVLSVLLSAIALRWRRTYTPITWVTGLLYAIPSVALFAFLVPVTGLGFVTAEIGLVSYTLLILVRNIVAGVDGVPAAVVEAADGMGYTPARRFVDVDLRLATPAIIAGLRIASVTIVGLVTVTALVGSGGYGALILDGLSRDFSTPIVVGATLSIALAVVLDLALLGLQHVLTPWTRHRERPA
ncbi:MAG: ABC transporter permease [Acidimicrobiales bacterium]|nr:ABC transporter permease [Acidimicrobiales bacterium]